MHTPASCRRSAAQQTSPSCRSAGGPPPRCAAPRERALVLAQPERARGVRRVGEGEEAVHRHGHRQDAVEDEKPPPGREPAAAVHAREKRRLQVAREHLPQHTGDDEEARAPRELGAALPAAEAVHDAGPGGGFGQADEEAQDVELRGGGAGVEAEDEEGPCCETAGEPVAGSDDGDYEVREGGA